MNFDEVSEIYDLIKEKKNIFFEAIAYRSHPQILKLFEILKNKNTGKIKKIEANFGFKIKRIKKDSRLFNKSLGGGSILDLGCYPISFFNLFVNNLKETEVLKSYNNLCETDVDIDGEIHLKLNNEISAIGKVSLCENLDNFCKIHCDNAIITIPFPWLPPEKTFLEIETKDGYYKEFINTNKNVYKHQIENVTYSFSDNNLINSFLVDIEESLEISKILDKWKS
jgi:predicted dehydrogenase